MRQLAVVIIPARLGSKRVPKKVLELIDGKSVLQRTYENAMRAKQPYAVVLAIDSEEELGEHANTFGKYVYRTSNDIRCGTCRVATVARHVDLSKADIVINVQADEIDIKPELIDQLITELNNDVSIDMVTAVIKRPKGFKPSENSSVQAIIEDGKLVDLVRSETDDPVDDYLEHMGIAGFRKTSLFKYLAYKPSKRDREQNNEYLTAIDAGFRIKVVEIEDDSISVNTEKDLKKARKSKPRKRKKKVTTK